MLARVIDFLKSKGITAVLTSLTSRGVSVEATGHLLVNSFRSFNTVQAPPPTG